MIRLHFLTWGRGEPLILLHGLFGSADNWATVGRNLAERFQVFALDQRNHGQSPHVPEMSYPLLAEDVVDFMDQHKLRRAHLLGHSMGGKTAMSFALRHPNRVGGLIVVDIAPRAYEPRHQKFLQAMLGLRLSDYASRAEIDAALERSIPEKAVRQFLLKSVARQEGGFGWKLNLPALQENYARLNEALQGGGTFGGPALFVTGGLSDYVQAFDHSQIRALFPAADFRSIPGVGHWVHAEAPREFLDRVAKFLADAPRFC